MADYECTMPSVHTGEIPCPCRKAIKGATIQIQGGGGILKSIFSD